MEKQWSELLRGNHPGHIRARKNGGRAAQLRSSYQLDYTIVGGAVNLASRLESTADVDEILISEDTFSLIKDVIACKPQDKITVKGIAYPVMTYSVIDLIESLQEERERIKAHLKGFKLSIDFEKLNYADKLYAREMLQQAMVKLEPGAED